MGEKRRRAAAVCRRLLREAPWVARAARYAAEGEGKETFVSGMTRVLRSYGSAGALGALSVDTEDGLWRAVALGERKLGREFYSLARFLLYLRRSSEEDAAELVAELRCMEVLES